MGICRKGLWLSLIIIIVVGVLFTSYYRSDQKIVEQILGLSMKQTVVDDTYNISKPNNIWYEVKNKFGYNSKECDAILHNNKFSIAKAKQYQKEKLIFSIQSSQVYFWLVNATCDCRYFKQQKGYWMSDVTTEEAQFPIAYSILVYRNADQVERLLRAIYRPSNVYCIHIDKKARASLRHSLYLISKCFPNVFISTKSEYVRWGKASIVKAELHCWSDLLEYKTILWKYLLNLTGQEYPLKTNVQLVKILKALNGTNNVSFNTNRKKHKRRRRPMATPYNITVTKGSTHMALSRGFVDFALNNPTAKEWFKWCFNLHIPDEHCFSSLNFNHHLNVPGSFIGNPYKIPDNWWVMRYKIWTRNKHNRNCDGRWLRYVCNIGLADLHKIIKSDKLFVNKIRSMEEPIAYHCLELWFRNLAKQETNFDVTLYSEVSSKRTFD